MPAVARAENTDSITTGHACDATAAIAGALQSRVIVNSKVGAVKGDSIAPHTILAGNSCVPHLAVINAGSNKVFFEGIAAARIGDSADAGSVVSGSSNVSAGG